MHKLAPPVVATLGAVAAMWGTRGAGLEDLDGANFLLGLTDFSLASHQPHFPGYPVYMAASWMASLVLDPVSALQLPGVLCWGLGLVLFHRALCVAVNERVAWLGWMLLLLSPLAWTTAGRSGSDAMGAGLALSAASCLAISWVSANQNRRWAIAAGLLGALSLGARPALFPWIGGLAVVALWSERRAVATGSFALGIGLWGLPFAVAAGPDLWAHGQEFVVGHFTRWGGAATVPEADSMAARGVQFTRLVLHHGFGTPVEGGGVMRWGVMVLWISGLAAGLRVLPRTLWRPLLAVAVPFALWLWIGQNPEKPRHILPLLPILATVAAAGLARADNRLLALGFFALGTVGLRAAALHHQTPSPEAQLASWLDQTQSPERVRLFCGQSERVIVALHPGFRAEYAADVVERDRRLGLGTAPPTLLWTDEVDGFERSPPGYGAAHLLVRFERSPLVDPHRPTLSVWTATRLRASATVGHGHSQARSF